MASFSNSKAPLSERPDLDKYQGVYISMGELITLRAHPAQVDLRAQRRALSAMTGNHRSRFRGRGIDFDEVRIYQPGDDIRNIDWRVTARTGKTHTKVFHEERERPVYLLTDQSQSMFFGTQKAYKSVVAARIAAHIAWISQEHKDRIGGFLFNDNEVQEARPKPGKRGIQQLFRMLVKFNQSLNTQQPAATPINTLGTALGELSQVVRPGSMVFVISDFHSFDDALLQHLSLISRHNDVVTIFIYDPMEYQLPPPGTWGFTDGSQNIRINTHYKQLRKDYTTHFLNHLAAIKEQLSSIAIPTIEISTAEDVKEKLSGVLGIKARSKSKPS